MNKAFDDQPVVVFIPPSICYMLHIDILKFKKKIMPYKLCFLESQQFVVICLKQEK